jgi:hypothetical protein
MIGKIITHSLISASSVALTRLVKRLRKRGGGEREVENKNLNKAPRLVHISQPLTATANYYH